MSAAELDSPVLKTPEWLEVLENKRKKPYKLAHEIGAGAPCLVCKDGCKGLNLHFWRKLCIECKCRKEDHEVQEDEDYSQFEILLGAKNVKRTTLKFCAQNKSFDWIPPNVSPDLAIDYLKSIPESKLPISNSEGARYRKQQLEKQVPLHDVDPNACFSLSDNEVKEFLKYLDNLKNNVIGQGKVLKYHSPIMLKENYFQDTTPYMLTESKECEIKKPEGSKILHQLTIDSAPRYSAFSCQLQTEAHPADFQHCKSPSLLNSVTLNCQPLRTQPTEKFENENSILLCPFSKAGFNSKPFHPTPNTQRESDIKTDLTGIQMGCPSVVSLKTPSCFMHRHSPIPDSQNNNMQLDSNSNMNAFGNTIENLSLTNKGKEYNLNEDKSPIYQDPYNACFCKDPINKLEEFNTCSNEVPFIPDQESGNVDVPIRKEVQSKFSVGSEEFPNGFPTPPATCRECLEILYPEEVVVKVERDGLSALWHAKCFVCEICKELLVDLLYFYHKGKVYCGRHYAVIVKIPRCFGCDELIFVKEYTVAESQSYHVHHFCCFQCDIPLGGKQYIPKDSFPVCLDCYQIKYGKNCHTCRLPIGAGEKRVSWKDLDFHVSSECFRCSGCRKSLLGGKFVVKNSNIFCSKECIQMTF